MEGRLEKMIFITFEGLDGCGKSVQIELLTKFLREKGFEVVRVSEPGGSYASQIIRDVLRDPDVRMNVMTEFLLFSASRSEMVEKVLMKNQDRDVILISDRFADSSYAYQVHGKGLDEDFFSEVTERVVRGFIPDLTIWIDVPPCECRRRLRKRGGLERMERLGLDFFARVRRGYLKLSEQVPDRFVRVEGHRSVGEVHKEIVELTLNGIIRKEIFELLKKEKEK